MKKRVYLNAIETGLRIRTGDYPEVMRALVHVLGWQGAFSAAFLANHFEEMQDSDVDAVRQQQVLPVSQVGSCSPATIPRCSLQYLDPICISELCLEDLLHSNVTMHAF